MENKSKKLSILIKLFIVILLLYLGNMGYYFCFIAGSPCMYESIEGYHYYLGKQFWWIGDLVEGIEYKVRELKNSQGYYDNLSEKEYQKYLSNVEKKEKNYLFSTLDLNSYIEIENYIEENQNDYLTCNFKNIVFYSDVIFDLEMKRLEIGLQGDEHTFKNNAIFVKSDSQDVLFMYFTENGFSINKNIFNIFRTEEISDVFQEFIKIINNGYMASLIEEYSIYFMDTLCGSIETDVVDNKLQNKMVAIALFLDYRVRGC